MNKIQRSLAIVAGLSSLVAGSLGFYAGKELAQPEPRQNFYQGNNVISANSLLDGYNGSNFGANGLTIRGKVEKVSAYGFLMNPENGAKNIVVRGVDMESGLGVIIREAQKNDTQVTVYASEFGQNFAKADLVAKGGLLFDLRTQ